MTLQHLVTLLCPKCAWSGRRKVHHADMPSCPTCGTTTKVAPSKPSSRRFNERRARYD